MAIPERSRFEQGVSEPDLVEMLPGLIELQRHPQFKMFLELLKGGAIEAREIGFAGTADGFDYWKGFVEGIQHARELTDRFITQGTELLKRAEPDAVTRPSRSQSLMDDSDTSF